MKYGVAYGHAGRERHPPAHAPNWIGASWVGHLTLSCSGCVAHFEVIESVGEYRGARGMASHGTEAVKSWSRMGISCCFWERRNRFDAGSHCRALCICIGKALEPWVVTLDWLVGQFHFPSLACAPHA